jgi:Fe2+ or Zn2+ uptake regulation protein
MTTEEQLTSALRERGMRVTPQRILIHRALQELGRHASAEDVLERASTRLPNPSLPTVYATLELLERLGIARRVAAGGGTALWDPRPEDHHHLACRSCGAVEDLDVEVSTQGALRAARRRGFRPDGSELIVSGLCRRCQTAAIGPHASESR